MTILVAVYDAIHSDGWLTLIPFSCLWLHPLQSFTFLGFGLALCAVACKVRA